MDLNHARPLESVCSLRASPANLPRSSLALQGEGARAGSPWSALERLPGLRAVPAVWRGLAGDQFDRFAARFLRRSGHDAESFPCPQCGCAHEIVVPPNGPITAVCACEAGDGCEDISLTPGDIELWQVNTAALGREIAAAFGCGSRPAELGLPSTWQVGAWSADSVPVILTIQSCRAGLRRVVADLVARLRKRFILLTPTARLPDVPALERLAGAGAALFDLESRLRITASGALEAVSPPGETFAAFTAEPRPDEQSLATRAVALVRQLDSEGLVTPPSALAVFRLFCLEDRSAAEIAREFRCSKPTVLRRLRLIREKTGLSPAQLRRLSAHFEAIEDTLSDPRARRVRPRSLMDAEEPGGGEE